MDKFIFGNSSAMGIERRYHFLTLINKRLHELLPNNRLIILPDASHRMWFEKPEECQRIVIEFLQANP
jgi:pimeloyl-ACP methyl ester carboxylesterase